MAVRLRPHDRLRADIAGGTRVGHDCVRIRFSSGTYVPWRFRVKRRDLELVATAAEDRLAGLRQSLYVSPAAVLLSKSRHDASH